MGDTTAPSVLVKMATTPGHKFQVNAVQVPPDFYESVDGWHFTLGDSDLDH